MTALKRCRTTDIPLEDKIGDRVAGYRICRLHKMERKTRALVFIAPRIQQDKRLKDLEAYESRLGILLVLMMNRLIGCAIATIGQQKAGTIWNFTKNLIIQYYATVVLLRPPEAVCWTAVIEKIGSLVWRAELKV